MLIEPRSSHGKGRVVPSASHEYVDQTQRIILFGSAARGEADTESDLDVLVIKDTPEPFVTRIDPAFTVHVTAGRVLDQ